MKRAVCQPMRVRRRRKARVM